MLTQRFGIEIELTGITRENAAKVIAEHFNSSYTYIGGSYREYGVKDSKGRTWKCVYDSSIKAERKVNGRREAAGNEFKTEVVSPILTNDDTEDLQEIVRKLRRNGMLVNGFTGIHIHIDGANYTPQNVRNLLNIVSSKEDLIYKALEVKSERLRYCKKMNEQMIKAMNERKPKTMEELKDIWYAQDPLGNRNAKYNSTRYTGINLHSLFTKGTIEARFLNSTTHSGRIKAYIQFFLAVSHQALIQKKASSRKTTTDNPKYSFRVWLLRLGLIGDEFKTCRHHLLKPLNGNAAFRHVA